MLDVAHVWNPLHQFTGHVCGTMTLHKMIACHGPLLAMWLHAGVGMIELMQKTNANVIGELAKRLPDKLPMLVVCLRGVVGMNGPMKKHI